MAKLLTKAYFNRHPLREMSAARYEYSLLLRPDFYEIANGLLRDHGLMPAAEALALRELEGAQDLASLLRFARRSLPGDAKPRVRQMLLEREPEALPEIQRMLLTTAKDAFVENALHVLTRCKADPVPWLLEHYDAIRYPYARSMMCLVLGFRATYDVVPFLMNQVDVFERRFPHDDFSQAPILALFELSVRFKAQ